MHLWFQALSRLLHIPQFSSLDDVFPSRLIIWRTENISAARFIPAPNVLAYQKIRHSNDPKKSPRGVHVIYFKEHFLPVLIKTFALPYYTAYTIQVECISIPIATLKTLNIDTLTPTLRPFYQ